MPVPLTLAGGCPARAKEGDNLRFSPSCESSSFLRGHGKNRRDETAPGNGRGFFSSVKEHSVLHAPAYTQCQILCCYTCGSVSAGANLARRAKRRSPWGYPCRATLWHVVTEGTCEFRHSLQFIFVGPVYHNTLTNCAALLSPRGPSLCPSGNSPCAAPSVDLTACVAVIYPTLRICGYMDAQSTSCGRKILCRSLIVSVLNNHRALSGKGDSQRWKPWCLPSCAPAA